jgi:hypothetical protein
MITKRKFLQNIFAFSIIFNSNSIFFLNAENEIKIIKYKNSYWVLDSKDL